MTTIVQRIWERDASLWKSEPEHRKIIKNSLGWLTVAETMKAEIPRLDKFAAEIKSEMNDIVLLGMGGSSLAPEVFSLAFGGAHGFPKLHVLDSTVPSSILRLAENLELSKTLFIVSSKSGGTVETDSFFRYFYDKIPDGRHFVAITDPGTSLAKTAEEKKFRELFLNPPDIGGRYSALSFFGLVPAALIGVDLKMLLQSAAAMMKQCQQEDGPGLQLGTFLGRHALQGKDKVTLMMDEPIASFGSWIEQLLAESTGKEGKGLIPIDKERPGQASVYGKDRIFVYLKLKNEETYSDEIRDLEKAGFPIFEIGLTNRYDLGAEFFRWEFAAAAAGSILKIDAFDQPNVQESKDNTKRLLQNYEKQKELLPPASTPIQLEHKPGDYLALMAYIERNEEHDVWLQQIRHELRDRMKIATTIGYGPRFLHSTGQLHKGGPNTGIFIQFTADDANDAAIPGEPYSFGVLKRAQALGDYESLLRHGRRAMHIDLGRSVDGGLERFFDDILELSIR